MNQPARYILNALTVLSMLLFLATALLWAACWRWPYAVSTEVAEIPTALTWKSERVEQAAWILSARGAFCFRFHWKSGKPSVPLGPRSWSISPVERPKPYAELYDHPSVWNRLGFAFATFSPGGSFFYSSAGRAAHGCILQVPCWFLAALTALLPSRRLATRWRAARRRKAGLCPHCGYDLRASKDRCPECGTEISK